MPFLNELPVAWEIYKQLGGNRFHAMTGAKNLVGSADSLSFQFGRNTSRSNRMSIRLEHGSDTYLVRFYHIKKHQVVVDADYQMVYAEDLRSLFERHTGMATHL